MTERYYSNKEYPLYTHYASCPTARYVGGVSKYLCECPNPQQCEGVRKVREEEAWQQPLTEKDIKKVLEILNMAEEGGEEGNEYKRWLAKMKERFHRQGLSLYYDPDANDMEGEWKVAPPLRQ